MYIIICLWNCPKNPKVRILEPRYVCCQDFMSLERGESHDTEQVCGPVIHDVIVIEDLRAGSVSRVTK